MSPAATLVTDGSPEAAALARWLRAKASGVVQVDALGPSDVPKVVRARKREGGRERLVVLASDGVEGADLDGGAALAVVREWLRELGPFEARERGAQAIDAYARADRPGAPEVLALLRRLSPTKLDAPTPKKRGRPKGESNPFRGAGFDLCVALLREPARTFSERALADAAERSYFAVHRVLLELDRRGYLVRDESGTRLAKREALRDDLAAAWAARVGVPRAARYFAPPPRRDLLEATVDAMARAGFDPVLAGPSALPPGRGLVGAPVTVYAPTEAADILENAGFRPMRTSGGALRVWPVLEKALVARVVRANGHAVTHPVVTYLDLMASTDDRERELARQLWSTGASAFVHVARVAAPDLSRDEDLELDARDQVVAAVNALLDWMDG